MDVAVIGANPWFLEAVRSLAQRSPGFRLGLAAACTESFVADPEARKVELAIVSCRAGSSDAAGLIAWAKRHHPRLRVVVKYPVLRPDLVRNAIQIGAWGVFSAEDPPETLTSVIDSVGQGRVTFPFIDFARLRDDPFEQLTRREREVLRALSQGWTNQQISARLGISPNTVKYHLKLIYDKLGVNNRSSAVAQYLSRQQA